MALMRNVNIISISIMWRNEISSMAVMASISVNEKQRNAAGYQCGEIMAKAVALNNQRNSGQNENINENEISQWRNGNVMSMSMAA